MKTQSKVSYADIYFQDVKRYFEKSLDLSFLEKIPGAADNVSEQKESILYFLEKAVKNDDFRKNSELSYDFIKNDILLFFIDAIFEHKSYIYERIMEEDKFNFDRESYFNFMAVALFLHDIFYIKDHNKLYIYNAYHYSEKHFLNILAPYIDRALSTFKNEIYGVSEIYFSLILKSAFPYKENDESVASTSRLIAIFDRAAKMLPNFLAKENTLTQNACLSMFSIIKANEKFLGFEGKILNELLKYAETITL